jgi:hypothetical protein
VRFIKAWNFYNGVGISSFYLEMFVVEYASTQNSIIYDIDISHCLSRLYQSGYGLNPITDPMGISSAISTDLTDYARTAALAAVGRAADLANAAYRARSNGDIRTALAYWNQFYKGRFPSYTL